MTDMIRLDIDIINMRFDYSDTDTASDVEYPDSDTDRFELLYTDSVSNTVEKYPYRFHPYSAASRLAPIGPNGPQITGSIS